MENGFSPLNFLSLLIGEFLGLRSDDFRTNMVAGLSAGFSRVFVLLVIMMLLVIVLAVLAFAFILLLGEAIGSFSGAAFIVGGVYLLGAAIVIVLRKKLFLKMFTNLFTGVMEENKPADSWKAVLLMLVRNIRRSLDT